MKLFTSEKQAHSLREWTYGYQEEGCAGGLAREFGIDMYTLLYLKLINNEDLLYSTGSFAQYYLTT